LIPLVLNAAATLMPAVQIFGTDYKTPDGTAIRDYVHVSDLARAHVLALHYLLDGGNTAAVNLASGQGASVRKGIDTACTVTGTTINVREVGRRPGDPAILVAEAAQARKLLGWSAERSDLAAIISDAWRWHRRRFCGGKFP